MVAGVSRKIVNTDWLEVDEGDLPVLCTSDGAEKMDWPICFQSTVIFIESCSNLVCHALIVHTLHPYSHYCFLCMGISDSDAVLMNAEKKRQKSLQCNSKISTKRFSALMGAVSAVGDSKRSSAVDDLNCHTQPSQVLALTSRCQMWLHVAYGV